MAHAILLRAGDSITKLREAVARSLDEKQKTRIRAIINIKKGRSRSEVAEQFVVDRTTVIAWVKAYNKGGVGALKMGKGGRPEGNPRWDTTIFDALSQEIDKGGRYWSVPLMQEWIKERHQADIPESTVWYHLRDLRYSYKSARPHPFKGDAAKQEAFKKGA